VDCFTSDPDFLSPGEGCRSTATKAVLDGIEDTIYRFGRRGRLGDEASSIRFLAKSVHWPVGDDARIGDCYSTSTSISIDVLRSRTRLDDGQGLRHSMPLTSPSH
jgi:hypothetical protein